MLLIDLKFFCLQDDRTDRFDSDIQYTFSLSTHERSTFATEKNGSTSSTGGG